MYFLGIAAFLLGCLLLTNHGVKQMGILRWLTFQELRPLMFAALVPVVAAVALYAVYETRWVWAGLTVTVGVLIALFGPYHRRTSPYYQSSEDR